MLKSTPSRHYKSHQDSSIDIELGTPADEKIITSVVYKLSLPIDGIAASFGKIAREIAKLRKTYVRLYVSNTTTTIYS